MRHFDQARAGGDKWLMQVGTLSGNPVAAAADLKSMEVLRREGVYDRLRATGRALKSMQAAALGRAGIPHQICGDDALFDIYFTDKACRDYRSAKHDDPRRNEIYNATLRKHGIFKSPGKLYVSLAVTDADLTRTQTAISRAVDAICGDRIPERAPMNVAPF